MRPEDFDDYAALWAEPRVAGYVGGQAWSRAQAWTTFLRNAGHWQMTGFGMWAVEPHRSRKLMGQVGFFYGMRGLGDTFDEWPEASWILHPDVQGLGYGREAADAAHDWFDRVVTGPLVSKLEPRNERSLAVATGLGYKPLRDAEWEGRPTRLMVRKTPPGGGTGGAW